MNKKRKYKIKNKHNISVLHIIDLEDNNFMINQLKGFLSLSEIKENYGCFVLKSYMSKPVYLDLRKERININTIKITFNEENKSCIYKTIGEGDIISKKELEKYVSLIKRANNYLIDSINKCNEMKSSVIKV